MFVLTHYHSLLSHGKQYLTIFLLHLILFWMIIKEHLIKASGKQQQFNRLDIRLKRGDNNNTCASLLAVKGNESSNGVICDVLGGSPLITQPYLGPFLKEQAQSIPGTVLN